MRVLLIVPAHNEARSLPAVAADLRRCGEGADVCVIDDGSTDETAAVARSLGFELLKLPVNLGIGGAVQAGYLWASQRGYDVAVQFDGDGQHDAASIPALLEPIRRGEADLVIGSRFLAESAFRSTPLRRAGIRYLSWFLRVRCGVRVTDPTSGFRAAGRRAIALFAQAYPSDYPEPEAIAVASRAGLAVTEVAAGMRQRAHGESSITPLRALYYFLKVSTALLLLPVRPRSRDGLVS